MKRCCLWSVLLLLASAVGCAPDGAPKDQGGPGVAFKARFKAETVTTMSTGTVTAELTGTAAGILTATIYYISPVTSSRTVTSTVYQNDGGNITGTACNTITGTYTSGTLTVTGTTTATGTIGAWVSGTGTNTLTVGANQTTASLTVLRTITATGTGTGTITYSQTETTTSTSTQTSTSTSADAGTPTTTQTGTSTGTATGTCPDAKACSPSPSDTATGVSVTTELSWIAGLNASTHIINYGKTIGTDTTPWAHSFSQAATHYNPIDLEGYTPYYWRIDEVNASGKTIGTVWSFTTGELTLPGQASSPSPYSGKPDVELAPTLTWSTGRPAATSHDVWFGTSETTLTKVGSDLTQKSYKPGTLTSGVKYYWRVDEKNAAGTQPGTVWNFTTTTSSMPGKAQVVSPADTAIDVSLPVTLSWTPGSGATTHTVYFGKSLAHKGTQSGTTYAATITDPGTYYWRIDEGNAAGTTEGTVWSFTTVMPAAQAARAKITRCALDPQKDASGEGYGHSADARRVNVNFAYTTQATWDDTRKANVIAATTRVELCIVDSAGTVTCSAGSDPNWLIYDSSSKPSGIAPTADKLYGAKDPGLPPGISPHSFRIPGVNYADTANKGKFVILRVNGESTDDARKLGGTCPLPYFITSSTHFEAYGTEVSVADPWTGKGFGSPCTGLGLYKTAAHCIDITAAQNVLNDLEGLVESTGWQISRFGSPSAKEPWRNGDDPSQCASSGNVCKGHIRIYPLNQEGAAGFYDHPGMLALASEDIAGLTDPLNGGPLKIMAHEMFHALQYKYSTSMHGGFVEGGAASIHDNACIANLSALSPRCVSAGQLGDVNGHIQGPFSHPWNNDLRIPYESGIYWRYFMEQYALPLRIGGFARPEGGQAAEIESNPDRYSLGDSNRFADEGTDLMRRILDAASSAGAQPPLLQLADTIVSNRLKRNLDNLLLDFHTAMLLKDYAGAPYEWRFEWVGDYNAGAASAVKPGAPKPAKPIEQLKPFALAANPPDNLPHVARVINRAPLGPTDTVANGTEEVVNAYGAAFLSVVPAMPADSIVRVKLRPAHHGAPRFRVFTVDPSGTVTLVPQCAQIAGTGPGAMRRCPAGTDGVVSVDVATGSGATAVAEILVVASASAQSVSFFYQLGASNPIVEIQSPISGQPALVGTPNPGGTAKPFLVEFVVRDGDGKSINGLSASQFRLSTISGSTSTVLSDVRLLPLSGGVYFARATMPVAALPTTDGSKLDLKVEYLDQTGSMVLASQTQVGVLLVKGTPPTVATELLLDISDSMNYDSGKKLTAMKKAASFLLDTIPNGDQVGVILYQNDANNWSALAPLDNARRLTLQTDIQGITAGGCTAMGDALLEGQSIFNLTTFPAGSSPILSMLMLSDGINTNNWMPSYYYAGDAPQLPNPPGNKDGSGGSCTLADPNPGDTNDWMSGSLKWSDQTLKPRVSTIAFGQDADLVELSNISNATGGVFAYADEGGVGQVGNATHALADAYRQGYNIAAHSQRIGTARVASTADLPTFTVEQSAQYLQVSLLSTTVPPSGYLNLVGPDGSQHAAVHTHGNTAVYRVSAPVPGQWTWYESTPPIPIVYSVTSTAEDGPPLFVEEVATSPLVLLGVADVEGATKAGFGADSGSWVGKNVYIRAIPTDGGDLLGVTVTGAVVDPNGATTNVVLADDGQHGDGVANDGIYGTILRNPQVAGLYTAKLVASGTSSKVGPFQRQTSVGFGLHAAPDGDGDTVPDWCDPQPLVPDATDDPDHDGLTNAEECALGTDPTKDDTDDGGEDDGTEVASGQDPTKPGDDRVKPYMIHVSACHGKVLVTPEAPISANVQVEVSSSGPFGAYALVYTGVASGPFEISAPTGSEQCYRMRTIGGAVSAWSPPYCLATSTASIDPNPPTVTLTTADGNNWVRSRRVKLNVLATDAQDPSSHLPRCTDATISGVTDMQVSLTGTFTDKAWVPYAPQVTVDLPATGSVVGVWVRVRDGAGNVSDPAYITLRIVNPLAGDFLLYGLNGVRLEDGVTLLGSQGGPGALASESWVSVTEIGAGASTGDVSSNAPVFLRAGGKIDGSVQTGLGYTQQDGAVVVGQIGEFVDVGLPGLPAYTIQPGTGENVTLSPDQTRSLAPGNYGNLTIYSRAKLTLRSGTYRFAAVQTESEAQVILNKTTGPVYIHAASLVHRATIIEQAGYYGQTLFAVSGTNPIFIEGKFIGTLLAPNAAVTIGTGVALEHWGAFQAGSILVRSRATLYHRPWSYSL
jgi:hypothetical protein